VVFVYLTSVAHFVLINQSFQICHWQCNIETSTIAVESFYSWDEVQFMSGASLPKYLWKKTFSFWSMQVSWILNMFVITANITNHFESARLTGISVTGEIIRPKVADHREKLYERKGIGCYMFRIDDETVIDATAKGNIARFVNHCCDVCVISTDHPNELDCSLSLSLIAQLRH
jgi:hypothetical protein